MGIRIKAGVSLLLASLLLAGCGSASSTAIVPPIEPSPTPLPPGTAIRPTDGMLMVEIQGGALLGGTGSLGSFWFDQTQVTNGQYLNCVEAGACELSTVCSLWGVDEGKPDTAEQPITCARWSDAKAYCEWAGGRLSTEIEWDYAAQAMGKELPSWGNTQFGFRCLVPTVWPAETWPTQGWITSTPAEQGLEPKLIAEGIARLKSTFPELHSLLIVRHGFLVVEEYYRGYRPTLSQDVASVNKSFLSALIGIAIEQGAIPGIDQRMMDYFPEYATPELDPLAYEVTIEDLLTMTSGFDWPEKEPVRPTFIDEALSSGMPQNTLLRSKIVSEPGSTFNYCTACTHLLSIILQQATGMPTQEFAQKYLMTPLGISPDEWDWDQIGLGYNSGGWGFDLTPRDMAKLGYLYLNNGNWDGNQIIPEEWVRTSRQKLVDLGQNGGYGYLWWRTFLGGHPAYYANGHGGQYIYVLPTLNLVVVVTQKTDSHNGGDPAEIIQDYFASAIVGAWSPPSGYMSDPPSP